MVEKAVHVMHSSPNVVQRGTETTLVIVTYDDLSIVGGSHSLIRDEFRYFERRLPTVLFSRKPRRPATLDVPSLYFARPFVPTRHLRLLASLTAIFLGLLNFGRKAHASVFHANDAYAGFVCCVLGRILKARTILTVHGPLTYEFVSFYGFTRPQFGLAGLLYFSLVRIIESYAYRHVDAIIAVSDFERKFVEKTRKTNVNVITNGINLTQYNPHPNRSDRLGDPARLLKGKKVVTFVGRMVPKNGVLVLARAIPKVVKARKDVVFLVVGDGFARDEFKAIISRADATSRVILVGEKPNPAPYYRVSDLFVSHVSSLMEGFGLTVPEAIACGVPVIVGYDPISSNRLSSIAHFVPKDNPPALAQMILRLLNEDLSSEEPKLRHFAESALGMETMFQRYMEVFRTGGA